MLEQLYVSAPFEAALVDGASRQVGMNPSQCCNLLFYRDAIQMRALTRQIDPQGSEMIQHFALLWIGACRDRPLALCDPAP
jgi:hypothetical protein